MRWTFVLYWYINVPVQYKRPTHFMKGEVLLDVRTVPVHLYISTVRTSNNSSAIIKRVVLNAVSILFSAAIVFSASKCHRQHS